MRTQIVDDGKTVSAGGQLTEKQKEALAKISVKPDAKFFENLDKLNEEIEETNRVLEEEREEKPTPVRDARDSVRPSARMLREQAREIKQESRPASRMETKAEEVKSKMSSEDDLIGELNKIKQEAEPEEAMSMQDELRKVLSKIPGAPSEADIGRLKKIHGDNAVYVTVFSETEAYVFTHLSRKLWQTVQENMADLQNKGGFDSAVLQEKMKEKVVQYCMLWPKLPIEFFHSSRAGVVPSLYEVIMLNSYFLTPQQAMALTVPL